MNKAEFVQRIVTALREQLRVVEEARQMANEEALPSDDLTESQREPRAIEAAYLVDGQSKLAAEVREAIAAYGALPLRAFGPGEPVGLSALVELDEEGRRTKYFLGPKAGGLEISHEGDTVFVLTPQSPLARRLIGRNLGDTIAVDEAARGRTARISALA